MTSQVIGEEHLSRTNTKKCNYFQTKICCDILADVITEQISVTSYQYSGLNMGARNNIEKYSENSVSSRYIFSDHAEYISPTAFIGRKVS